MQKCESDKKAGILPVSSVYSAIRFRRTMNSEPSPGALRTAMLPPEFCLMQTAHDAGTVERLPDVEKVLNGFAGHIAQVLMQ